MRLEPVDFRLADRSIREAYPCVSFEFPPPPPSVLPSQEGQDPNPGADCDGLNVSNLPDNLKVHPGTLCQTLAKNPRDRLTSSVARAPLAAVWSDELGLKIQNVPFSPLKAATAQGCVPICVNTPLWSLISTS